MVPAVLPGFRRTDPLLMLDGAGGAARVPLWPVPHLKIAREVQRHKAQRKDTELAEYRRLLYVAMTRARDELYLCFPKVNTRGGPGGMMNSPSRFLQELPQDLYEPLRIKRSFGW